MSENILFMGTPEIAKVCLAGLLEKGFSIQAAVSQPDRPVGRGQKMQSPPVAELAKEKNIPLFQPPSVKEPVFLEAMEKLKPDLTVVVAYGQLLPRSFLDLPRVDTINLHASLLPEYRGAAPINWAIIHGKKITGLTIMGLVPKMDAGPLYGQKQIPIHPTDTTFSLTQKMGQEGAEFLAQTIPSILSGELKATPQEEEKATYAPLLKKEDGHLNWALSSTELGNWIRGLNPWPMATTFLKDKQLKIIKATPSEESFKNPPGEVALIVPQGFYVSCGKGSLLVEEVQLEGKKKMPASDFTRGFRLQEGTLLGQSSHQP